MINDSIECKKKEIVSRDKNRWRMLVTKTCTNKRNKEKEWSLNDCKETHWEVLLNHAYEFYKNIEAMNEPAGKLEGHIQAE